MENNEKYEAEHKIEFDNEQQHAKYIKLLAAIQRNDKGEPNPKHSNKKSIIAIMDYISDITARLREYRFLDEKQTAHINYLTAELSKNAEPYKETIRNQNKRISELADKLEKAQTVVFEHSADAPAESADEPPYSATDKKVGANSKNDSATDNDANTFDEFIFNSKNILVFVSVLLITIFIIGGYVLRSEPTRLEKPTAKVENATQVKSKLPNSQHIENKFKKILSNK